MNFSIHQTISKVCRSQKYDGKHYNAQDGTDPQSDYIYYFAAGSVGGKTHPVMNNNVYQREKKRVSDNCKQFIAISVGGTACIPVYRDFRGEVIIQRCAEYKRQHTYGCGQQQDFFIHGHSPADYC
jgi:hypothetical protein